MVYKNWSISFEVGNAYESFTYQGIGLTLTKSELTKSIALDIGYKVHEFLSISKEGEVILKTPALFLYPIYHSLSDNKVLLSNKASVHMTRLKEIKIKPFTFVRHLLGLPYPEENIFENINLLHASSAYRLIKNEFQYERSLLSSGECRSGDEAIDYLIEDSKAMFSDGAPISVLLSGGYDSRLNLALTNHHQKEYGNEVRLYHEYKNDVEFQITKSVAEEAGLQLTTKGRTDFIPKERAVFLHEELIDLQSGFYRENLIRWHQYFDWIKKDNHGGMIFGFGVEAHKGKYYNKVLNLGKDAQKTFGTNIHQVKRVGTQMGLKVNEEEQNSFFDNLLKRSLEFDTLDSQIDHVHYHTYCANGYGKRCHDLLQLYDLSFPFLDHTFLKMVFSLPKSEKEGFALVKNALDKLAPNFNNINFTSANAKSLEKGKSGLIQEARHSFGFMKRFLGGSIPRKGRMKLSENEKELVDSLRPQSEVTLHLHELLSNDWTHLDSVQLDYLVQAFLYLTFCEKTHGVSFRYSYS